MDRRLDSLFSTLEAQFGASIDREEDEAASDLAWSLRHDLGLRPSLLVGGVEAHTPFGHRRVREVAKDHVWTEDGWLIPLGNASFRRVGGRAPADGPLGLVERLRDVGRRGRPVGVVTTPGRSVTGPVYACSAEHLSVGSAGAEELIPWGQVLAIRLSPED